MGDKTVMNQLACQQGNSLSRLDELGGKVKDLLQ